MGKSKLTLKIDKEVKELAKQKYNVSQTVEKHLQELISTPENKEERIEEINQKIKDEKDKISECQQNISNLQSEKNVLEKELKQEAEFKNQKHKFFRIAKKNIGRTWHQPEDIPEYWTSKFDESIDELWKLAKNSDAKPAERKKESSNSMASAGVQTR